MNKFRSLSCAVFSLCIVVIIIARATSLLFDYYHPDETIAVSVVDYVLKTKSLDTNWALTSVDPHFRYPQYNFSGFHLISAVLTAAIKIFTTAFTNLELLRFQSAVFSLLIAWSAYLLSSHLFTKGTGMLTALLVLITPLLYQDSLYARPEALATLIATLSLFQLLRARSPSGIGLAYFALGFLISIKVSFAAFGPLFLVLTFLKPSADNDSSDNGFFLRQLFLMLFLSLLGFLVGVPAILTNPLGYLGGVEFLLNQYTSGHWPHGLPQGSFIERLGYSFAYFSGTLGLPFLLAIAFSLGLQLKAKNAIALTLLLYCTALWIWHSHYPVFFERNFSYLLPVFCVFAAHGLMAATEWIANRRTRLGLTVFLIGTVGYAPATTSALIRFQFVNGSHAKSLHSTENKLTSDYAGKIYDPGWLANPIQLRQHAPGCEANRRILRLRFPQPELPQQFVDQIDELDLEVIAQFSNGLGDLPANTLSTYFAANILYLSRKMTMCEVLLRDSYTVNATGDLISPNSLHLEGWVKNGAYPGQNDIEHYGSWDGSDANQGHLKIAFNHCNDFFIPIKTGPVAIRQRITIEANNTGEVVFLRPTLLPLSRWTYFRVNNSSCRDFNLIAEDRGENWGEWMAVGNPLTSSVDAR